MDLLLWLAATGGAGLYGYIQSRRFVRRRLRFVDAVEKPVAPVVAGSLAALAALPVAALLPVIGVGSALLFGASVGLGVRHGVRDNRLLPP